ACRVRGGHRPFDGPVADDSADRPRHSGDRVRSDAAAARERPGCSRSSMSAGRDGDLAAIFRRLIRNTGPISLSQFRGESNARYYANRDPLGSEGDFVTAPEISQMFGELIGLWLADMWIRAGREEPVLYVELGPGRGTLAKDALRAGRRYGFVPEVHLVEASIALRELQGEAVPGAIWHADLSTVPQHAPLL